MPLEAPSYQGYPRNVLTRWKTSKNIRDLPEIFRPFDQHGILTAENIGVFPEIFSEDQEKNIGEYPEIF